MVEDGPNGLGKFLVCVGHPAHWRGRVKWGVEWLAIRALNDTTSLLEDERSGDVVRMATEVGFDSKFSKGLGSEVGNETIMPGKDLVELSVG